MPLHRRRFIQLSTAGVGAATVGSGLATNLWGLAPDVVNDPQTEGDRVVPTFCEICFWKCGVNAHVKDGRVTKIVGNPEHPLSKGRLCPRGTGGAGLLYDPDRIKQPLVRRQKRGDDVFEPVSWDAALNEVATKLETVKARYGPEAVALFSHGCGGGWFKPLMKDFGTPNIAQPSYAQCRGSREAAFELTFGSGVGSPESTDMANSRVITLIGSHLGENMHNTQVQDFAEAVDRGAQLIVVDPRFSTAAGKARHWLPIRPGTDTALLLAWIHVILRENLHDAAYLDRYATGLDELKAHVAGKTPEWAFPITGIEPSAIEETARLIGGARPASLVHPGRRTAWYGTDTQRGRAIAILNALVGSWGREGGFVLPTNIDVPNPNAPHPQKPDKLPADMPAGTVFPFAGSVLAHGLRDASIPGTADYDIKAWIAYGTNLLMGLPNPERTREALRNLDFVVAIDVLPAEICGWADVVLPESTYLERYDDLQSPPYREPFVALRQPVVPPIHDTKPGWWMAKELAKRWGREAELFPWDDPRAYLKARVDAMGRSFEELERKGVLTDPKPPLTIEDGVEPTFGTPSGKIELFSQQLADAGHAPLPEYEPVEQPGPGEFRLLFGRAPTHTFGRTANNRFLASVYAENELWVPAGIAKERGLQMGEEVVLVGRDGTKTLPIKVRVTQRIRPDCVYMTHGFGHTAQGLRFAKGKGADDNQVAGSEVDPIMGGTGMNATFVKVEAV